jgi:hypothetical protein
VTPAVIALPKMSPRVGEGSGSVALSSTVP